MAWRTRVEHHLLGERIAGPERISVDPIYDLVVIGGGTAGLVSAHIAAMVGARVAMVERDAHPGGDCLWTGCVPSKALLAAAELAHRMRDAGAVGLAPVTPEIDFARVMAHVRGARDTIAPHDSAERLRAAGVEVVHGAAAFTSERSVTVGARELRFRRAILATGSRPATRPGALSTDTVWDLDVLPARLLVIGGGPVGCELAQAFARLGSAVTLCEAAPRLLGNEDERAGALVAERLRAEGVDVRTDTSDPDTAGFDQVLVAAGRVCDTAGLGLARAGIETDADGFVTVDARLRTSNRRVFAAGDVVADAPHFTHVAAHHARVAVPNALFGARTKVETAAVPRVTYTDPEVASVGLSAPAARERWGAKARVVDADYGEVDRAITAGVPYGFARLVGDPRGRLVGATVAAPAAGEAIAELTAWLSQGAGVAAVSRTIHAYPTFAEGPSRAADEHLRERFARTRIRPALRVLFAARRALSAAR